MTKVRFSSVLGLALALGATSLQAQAEPLEAWVGQVNRQIDEAMAAEESDATGEATVTFRRASDGTATDIAARAPSRSLRTAAIDTAQSLRGLPPLPADVAGDQRITMRLLFGSTADAGRFERRRAALLASAALANRQFAERVRDDRLALRLDPR